MTGVQTCALPIFYCKKEDTTKNRQFWDEHAKRSLMMFEEAGVKVNYYEE